ncbi:hypothetical protein [Rubrivirga sp.]|uniref:hypothetical protein n=1 Tax=Rubrivirga sp. TaxID=1885344 RepID=UPI003B515B62
MSRRALRLGVALAALALGCEVPLDPIEPSDLYFSMSGYLDASVDTQWVRVEPLAQTTAPDAAPIDAAVTLVDLGTGAEVALTQRVRSFPTGPAHLFWTTAPVPLGARYRLDARRPDGAETSAPIEIPADGSFDLAVRTGGSVCPTTVVVSGDQRVVEVQARYRVARPDGQVAEFRFSHADSFQRLDDGSIRASIYFADDARRMDLDPIRPRGLLSAEVVTAVATEAWPDPVGLALEDVLQVEGFGVENGVGFVGGAVTEREPFVPGVIVIGFGPDATVLPCTSSR